MCSSDLHALEVALGEVRDCKILKPILTAKDVEKTVQPQQVRRRKEDGAQRLVLSRDSSGGMPPKTKSRVQQGLTTLRIVYDFNRGRTEYIWVHLRYTENGPILIEERIVRTVKEEKIGPERKRRRIQTKR